MSISENVGALSNYLARVISGRLYAQLREGGKRRCGRCRPCASWRAAPRSTSRAWCCPGTLFEEMGFNYVGPIDGHDLARAAARAAQRCAARAGRSCCTWSRARARATRRPRPIRSPGTARARSIRSSGTIHKEKAGTPSYSQVFGQWLCDMAERDPRIVAITPAMREGSGLVEFSRRFPERYFDVAIAEQHAVTFAAGLACEGMRPVVAIYSTFLQRGYDQTDPRRGAAEPAGGVRHRSRRPGRQRWRHASGQLRSVVPALHSQHGHHGAGRRGRMPADALHRHDSGRARRRCAIRAAPGPGVADQQPSSPRCRSAARELRRQRRQRPGAAGLRQHARPRRCASASASMPRWSTCASSSRSMWRCCARSPPPMLPSSHSRRTWSPAAPAAPAPRRWMPRGGILPRLHIGIPDRFIEHGSREDCLAAAGLDFASIALTIERWRADVPALKLQRAAPRLAAGAGLVMNTAVTAADRGGHLRRGRAVPRRHSPHSDQPRRNQGHPPPGAGQGPLQRRAAHGRDLQHVREPAAQLQGHAHVALRGDPASRARDLGRLVPARCWPRWPRGWMPTPGISR